MSMILGRLLNGHKTWSQNKFIGLPNINLMGEILILYAGIILIFNKTNGKVPS